MPAVTLTIPVLEAKDYPAVRDMMKDADMFPATFEKHWYVVDKQKRRAIRAGMAVVLVYLDSKSFADFCQARGLQFDKDARKAYAHFMADRVT